MLPGFDVCDECEGTGVENDCRWANEDLGHDCDGCPCPACSGVGSVPGDAAVEAVAQSLVYFISGDVWQQLWPEALDYYLNAARAALVAYAQTVKEENE